MGPSHVISIPYLEMTFQIITNIYMADTFTTLDPPHPPQAPLTLKFMTWWFQFSETISILLAIL